MGARILLVCTANVCRSPLAELVLRSAFDRAGLSDIAVASAAARSTETGSICPVVSRHRSSPEWQTMAAAHRPRSVTTADLTDSNLILVATRSNRGAIARLAPEARRRTFTMREVGWLSVGFEPHSDTSALERVTSLATYMDGQRGVRSPPPVRSRRFQAPASDPLTIPDGHNLGSRKHRRTIESVAEAAAVTAGLLGG